MSQVLANPESSDFPENDDPPKVETSKLISLFAKKITDKIDIPNKCKNDQRFINNDYLTFLFITLKVQNIRYLFFTFFAILLFEVPMWSTHYFRNFTASICHLQIPIIYLVCLPTLLPPPLPNFA